MNILLAFLLGLIIGAFVVDKIYTVGTREAMKKGLMFMKKDSRWIPYNPFKMGE